MQTFRTDGTYKDTEKVTQVYNRSDRYRKNVSDDGILGNTRKLDGVPSMTLLDSTIEIAWTRLRTETV